MKPQFKIIDTFKITNRGYVICGDIIDGIISIGDKLKLGNEFHEIIGVEMIDNVREGIAFIGLLIPVFDDLKIDKIKNLDLIGKTIEINKTSNFH